MPTTREALVVLVLFLIPGFIADSVLGRVFPRGRRETVEVILSIGIWALVNYALFLLLVPPRILPLPTTRYTELVEANRPTVALLIFGILLLAPAVEAVALGRVLSARWVRRALRWLLGFDVLSAPTAWADVFTRNRGYVALATLTDGSKVAGLWASESYAGLLPGEEDLYLEVTYPLGPNDTFEPSKPLSAGVLLKRADIRTLELFRIERKGSDGRQDATKRESTEAAGTGHPQGDQSEHSEDRPE